MSWQSYLERVESVLRGAEGWLRVQLPQGASPGQQALVVMGTFLAIALGILVVGRVLMGFRRNRVSDHEPLGSKRPLIFGPLTEMLAWMFPLSRGRQETLRKELLKAGYYHRKALEEFLAFRNAAVCVWLVFVGLTVVLLADAQENLTPRLLLGGGVIMVVLYALPRIVIHAQADQRAGRIQYALADALDMINMTVTGGLPLRQAIQRVGRALTQTHPDMACELAIVHQQAEAGSLDQSLRQFSTRVDLPDVTALATMVRHAEQLGGNVATAFRDFSDSVRQTRRQRAEERGNKASVKLLFPVILFLTPPIYILLLGPAGLELKNFLQKETAAGGALTQSAMDNLRDPNQLDQARSSARIGAATPRPSGEANSPEPTAQEQ